MELTRQLEQLDSELRTFACRPSSLVADLVLVALATDLLETGLAVREASRTELPHKAYPNARLAFETAQNLLVLATHEHYELAGAVAWVYFESKDAPWRSEIERAKSGNGVGPTDEQWLDTRVDQMVRVWNSVSPGAADVLQEALATVRRDRKKGPDNWLHQNMSDRHHRSYTLLATKGGNVMPADTAELNEKMYRVLCRETHVRPRLDSFGVIHNSADNTVRIDILPRNLDRARRAVVGGTELAISEGVAALRWQRTAAV
jgi:hypothetical protein